MNADVDVRSVLPLIRVPTLVLHRREDRLLKVEEGQYVASRIPGARFVELEGEDHLPFVGEQNAMLGEIQEFLTGTRTQAGPRVVLATLLAVVIEGDVTEQAARRLLDHIRQELAWFRGEHLTPTAHGFVAAFDGPARAIRCGRALASAAPRFGGQLRVGLHTGECTQLDGDLTGLALEIAEELARHAAPGEVIVSRTVTDLVAGSGFHFEERGIRTLLQGLESSIFAV
jgi:hypothetical protein